MCNVETFYSVLGVARDADRQAIVRAYRDKAKSNHPDVCDSPDATETFRRLTTAKEVLADETERAAYDRLGHETYVRRRADCSDWSAESDSGTACAETSTQANDSTGSAAAAAARPYADGGSSTGEATPRTSPTRSGSGGTATAYYRPGQRMNPDTAPSGSDSLFSRFQSVGPWLLLDGILLVSALATAWVIVSWGSLSALSIVLAAVLCVATLAATTLHLSVRAFA